MLKTKQKLQTFLSIKQAKQSFRYHKPLGFYRGFCVFSMPMPSTIEIAYLSGMEKKVFLLDAFALVFRAYYALIRNPRLTSKGKNTNAQFGFTNALVELITKQKPSHMAVCFDTSAPTERHTDFADYKANRQETPEDISAAVPDIKKIIEGFNIPVIAIDGYEADDVIGTLSKQAEKAGYEVYMVTPDKDYGQLVSEKIKIYKPAYQGNDAEIMGPEEVCAKWNIKDVSTGNRYAGNDG